MAGWANAALMRRGAAPAWEFPGVRNRGAPNSTVSGVNSVSNSVLYRKPRVEGNRTTQERFTIWSVQTTLQNAIARHIICREEVREVRVMHNLVSLVHDLLHLLHRKLQLLGILHDLAG